ncbi:hypothetical protein PV326_008862, partial [Microctonus aethiopoides]
HEPYPTIKCNKEHWHCDSIAWIYMKDEEESRTPQPMRMIFANDPRPATKQSDVRAIRALCVRAHSPGGLSRDENELKKNFKKIEKIKGRKGGRAWFIGRAPTPTRGHVVVDPVIALRRSRNALHGGGTFSIHPEEIYISRDGIETI